MQKLFCFNQISRALFCAALLASTTARGATIAVTNTHNSLAGSLRQAVQDANPAGGDTIVFQIPASDSGYNAPLNTFFITLTAGPEMTIAKDLTIDGTGAKIVIQRSTAAGTPNFYFFNVTAGGEHPQPDAAKRGR